MLTRTHLFALTLLLLFFSAPSAWSKTAKELSRFSLDELMEKEVMSAAKVSQPLIKTAAAVFVIDQEDIQRSSAENIPELLRMVPGLEIARISAHQWAVTARGFNGLLANKLLVMIDGRSVYTHLYAGVYWDIQDLVLDDIERIEVIRGPGGSVWGSNAVNGVINIITKHTSRTQGVLLKGGGGSERQQGTVRYGGSVAEDFTYRVYGKHINHDSSYHGNDAWYLWRTGGRADWQINSDDSLTIEGDYYNGEEDIRNSGNFAEPPYIRAILEDQHMAGGYALLRWQRLFSPDSDGVLQTYFDVNKRDQSQIEEMRYTFDTDWTHRFLWGPYQEIVWGLGYRLSADETDGSFNTSFNPASRTFQLFQGFLQDTLTLFNEHVLVTGGIKTEHNTYTGFEFQPTARILWNPHPKHSVWLAFSRAVRIPSRIDRDLTLRPWIAPPSLLLPIYSDTTRDSEVLLAFETGYRTQPHRRVSVDIAAFANFYDNVGTTRLGTPFMAEGRTNFPVYFDDQAKAQTYGAELALHTLLQEWWQFYTAYTFLNMEVDRASDLTAVSGVIEKQNPQHQIFLRSRMNLPQNIEFDSDLRFVDRLPALNVPSYWELNVRMGWRPVPALLLELIGRNLISNHHREFTAGDPQIQRSVYAEATLEF